MKFRKISPGRENATCKDSVLVGIMPLYKVAETIHP